MLTVPDDYPTIQAAVNAAIPGDTVHVSSGTYYESVMVNKTVLLIGQNRETTIIAAGSTADTLALTADGVLISNFTIGWGAVGIDMQNSNGNRIINNIIKENTNGATGSIYTDTIYENNIVTANTYGLNFGQLNGPSSINNTAKNNEIYGNTIAGIYVSAANGNNTISGNNIHDNGIGIILDHTQNNTVTNNTIKNNNLAGGYNYGIYLRNAIKNVIDSNMFQGNNVALHFINSSNGNKIFHNNFIGNPKDADGTSLNTWDNGYPSGGNYWSGYLQKYPHATEIDGSGIWNTPYVIDRDNVDNYPLIQPWNPVSEFQPLFLLPLFVIATLLAAVVLRRKRGDDHGGTALH